MVSKTDIYQDSDTGRWHIKGSSESFISRSELIRTAKERAHKKATKRTSKVFISGSTGKVYRSSWEVELADLLDELEIAFEYEPKRFYFEAERESYLPDFYLPEYNVWIEVKGWLDKRSYKRAKLFKKYHGHEFGYFLFMKEERELVVKQGRTQVLLQLIDVALTECERIKKEREENDSM